MVLPVAGWYKDPNDSNRYRWWDGTSWTSHVHDPNTSITEQQNTPLYDSDATRREEEPVSTFVTEEASYTEQNTADFSSSHYEENSSEQYQYETVRAEEEAYYEEASSRYSYEEEDEEEEDEYRRVPFSKTRKRGTLTRRVVTLVGAVAAALVVLAGGAVAAFILFSGSGPQPEQAMPADTAAYAKIDLNPDAGQKVNLIRFLNTTLPDDIGADVNADDPLGSFLQDQGLLDGTDISWETDIRPWLGDRAAVVIGPASVGNLNEPPAYVLVSVKDEEAMNTFMASESNSLDDIYYAMVKDGYAVFAADQTVVDYVVNAPVRLPENPNYQAVLDEVGTGQIFSLYTDIGLLTEVGESFNDDLLGDTLSLDGTPFTGFTAVNTSPTNMNEGLGVSGSLMLSVRVEPDMIDVQVAMHQLSQNGLPIPFPQQANTDLTTLPENILAGFTIAGLGDSLRNALASNPDIVSEVEFVTGIPQNQLFDMLNTTITVGVTARGDEPDFVVRVAESPAATVESVTQLVSAVLGEDGVAISQQPGYIYLSTSDVSITEFTSDSTNVSEDPVYQRVIGDDSGAQQLYVNLQRVWEFARQLDPSFETYDQILGVGWVASGGEEPGSGNIRLRVLFQPPAE